MTSNFSGPLEDRIAIRELLETYADAIYRSDEPLWASLWVEDASWEFPHLPDLGTVRGRDKLVALWRGAATAYPRLSVIITPGAIHVTGDTATGRTYSCEIFEDASGHTKHSRPTYYDTYVKRDGRWLIQSRVSHPRHFTS